MKGTIKITVEETDEKGVFPVTRKFTFERDNTFEDLNDWIEMFKSILFVMSFHVDIINELFPDE